MSKLVEELKERIIETYDPDQLVDILGLTTEQLVDLLEEQIIEQGLKFSDLYDQEEPPWES